MALPRRGYEGGPDGSCVRKDAICSARECRFMHCSPSCMLAHHRDWAIGVATAALVLGSPFVDNAFQTH